MECDGRVALVTGAAAGTGKAIAQRLVSEGAKVVLADTSVAGEQIAAGLGDRAAFITADVTSDADVRVMIDFAVRTFGGLDILINNAGGGGLDIAGPSVVQRRFPEADRQQWSRIIDLNLRGPMLATQCALEVMRGRGGVIINMASIAGAALTDYRAPEYATAKAGLIRFTACLTHLHQELNVRVNCLAPDWIGTARAQREWSALSEEERWQRQPPIPLEVIGDQVMECIRDDRLAGAVLVINADRSVRRLTSVGGF